MFLIHQFIVRVDFQVLRLTVLQLCDVEVCDRELQWFIRHVVESHHVRWPLSGVKLAQCWSDQNK
jgi:hypothetical protein